MVMNRAHALARDELIRVLTAYTGTTTEDGLGGGTTLVDINLKDNPSISQYAIPEKTILIMSGDAIMEDKGAASFDNGTGKITLQGTGFSAQIKAGTTYRILNISSVEIDVETINTKIGTNTDAAGTSTIFAWLLKLFEHGGQGLVYYGEVTQVDLGTQFRVAGLAGFGNAYFANTYRVYVVRDAAGLGAAPQGEMQPCTAYTSVGGIFTHPVFTAGLGVGDEVLLLHERVAEIADLVATLGALNTAAAEGAVTTEDEVMAYVKQLVTAAIAEAASTARVLCSMDFWSDPQEEIPVPAVAATLVFTPTVEIADLPGTAIIVRAIAMFKFRMIENVYDGANALDGATDPLTSQVIQVKETAAGAYVDAINFVDNQFTFTELAREGGDVLIGSIDIAGEVDDNGNYTFRWLLRKCDGDFINMNDCQVGLRIWYSI